jgi:hypothetical protein
MVSWADFRPAATFGFNIVDLAPDRPPVVERIQTSARQMHAYGLDDATGMSARDVLDFLDRQVAAVSPLDAYCEVCIRLIEQPARRELNLRAIEDLFQGSAGLRFELTNARTSWAEVRRRIQDVGTPTERFEALVATSGGDDEFREAVRELGLELLERAEASLLDRET